MKKAITLAALCGFVAFAYPVSSADTNRSIAHKILEVYPQADVNGDGQLSKRELAAVGRVALKRYPDADVDGDGKLSIDEQETLLARLSKKAPAPESPVSEDSGNKDSGNKDSGNEDSETVESTVRQGPRPIRPGAHGVGQQIPDLKFTDIAGQEHRLSDFGNHMAIVFAMTGTGCPLCLKYSPSLAEIESQYRDRGVAFIFLNPNESESIVRMQDAIKKHGFIGPYVQDSSKRLPGVLGAKTTTEVFVIDRARTLVYRGAVDDQYGFAYALDQPRETYLTDALDAVLDGQTPDVRATSSPGCELFYEQEVERSNTTITYHNRVSRIIQTHCIECHRDGGIAPIAFETYEEVKDYASMIGKVVDRGVMPPWFAAPQPARLSKSSSNRLDAESQATLHWANDRSLSSAEKSDLFAWIKAGAPEGDSANAPLPRTFPDGWLIGKPDKVFQFPRPVPVKATGIMPYKNITIENDLPEDKWVQAIEVRPGQPDVVHHVIVSIRADGGEIDERDGYWGAYVPGNSTLVYPDGYARFLPKGAKLRFQMHYTAQRNGDRRQHQHRVDLLQGATQARSQSCRNCKFKNQYPTALTEPP